MESYPQQQALTLLHYSLFQPSPCPHRASISRFGRRTCLEGNDVTLSELKLRSYLCSFLFKSKTRDHFGSAKQEAVHDRNLIIKVLPHFEQWFHALDRF